MATAAASLLINHEDSSWKLKDNMGKIPFSNVVVRRRPRAYWGRKWSKLDIIYGSLILSSHLLCLLAPSTFSWDALGVALAIYQITCMLGINLGYHRGLSHRAFKLPKVLEYFFVYIGVLAGEGSPIDWVSNHRFHHKYTDKDQDPHSPINGFWYSHISWVFNQENITNMCGERKNVEDLKEQWFYRFLQNTYILHTAALGLVLYKYGGIPYVVWGMGVRMVFGYHVAFLVGSVCHIWGHQAWNTGDLSRNNWWVALMANGEGWHNNHHAFEYSARHGLEWWQLDTTWITIKTLELLGLATDVKVPSDAAKQRLSFKKEEKVL